MRQVKFFMVGREAYSKSGDHRLSQGCEPGSRSFSDGPEKVLMECKAKLVLPEQARRLRKRLGNFLPGVKDVFASAKSGPRSYQARRRQS